MKKIVKILLEKLETTKFIITSEGETDFKELCPKKKKEIFNLFSSMCSFDGDADGCYAFISVPDVIQVTFWSRAEYTSDFEDYLDSLDILTPEELLNIDEAILYLRGLIETPTKKFDYKIAITHSGVFHADDVFGAALVKLLNPNIEITRVMRVPEDISDDIIVYDIGGGLYDHHQKGAECRRNGIKYAAFGLLWRDFGHLLVTESQVNKFDEMFVQSIDAPDNGEPINAMYQAISSFVPNWDDDDQDMDTAFERAVNFAKEVLKREIVRIQSSEKARAEVTQALNKSDGEIVILDHFVPWQDLIPSTAKFVIFPSLRGGYNAQAIPSTIGGRDQKVPFPAEWAGADRAILNDIVSGMTFCHPGRFMVGTETILQACTACKLALTKSV